MQAVNIECQIAQAQLRRYLTGEDMPSAVVNELETHLRNCQDCMAAAQTLRESLKGVLSSKISGKPEPRREEPAMTKAVATGKAAVQTPADVFDAPDTEFKHTPAKKKSNFKTLAYSGALALVLVLMSTIFKDPTALFGARASEKRPDTPAKATEAEPKPTVNEPIETEVANTEPAIDESAQPASSATTDPPTGEQPTGLKTDGFLIADGSTGTTVVKKGAPKKEEPKPQPTVPANRSPRKKPSGSGGNGIGTIKVYPPEK